MQFRFTAAELKYVWIGIGSGASFLAIVGIVIGLSGGLWAHKPQETIVKPDLMPISKETSAQITPARTTELVSVTQSAPASFTPIEPPTTASDLPPTATSPAPEPVAAAPRSHDPQPTSQPATQPAAKTDGTSKPKAAAQPAATPAAKPASKNDKPTAPTDNKPKPKPKQPEHPKPKPPVHKPQPKPTPKPTPKPKNIDAIPSDAIARGPETSSENET